MSARGSELVDFLLERIAEDEAWAKREERAAIRTHHIGRPGPCLPHHFSRAFRAEDQAGTESACSQAFQAGSSRRT